MKNQKGEALTVAVVLLMLGMMIFGHSWGMMRGDHGQRHNDHDAKEHQLQKDESIRRGETRPTLDPKLFQDERVRSAYQAAREIPWVLDSIYCYCFCEESFQHKSLLSCYVDDHAAGWEICLGEALRAFELYKKGYPIKKIKDMVEQEYKL